MHRRVPCTQTDSAGASTGLHMGRSLMSTIALFGCYHRHSDLARLKAAFHDTDTDTDSPETPIHPYVRHERFPREDVGVTVVESGLYHATQELKCGYSTSLGTQTLGSARHNYKRCWSNDVACGSRPLQDLYTSSVK